MMQQITVAARREPIIGAVWRDVIFADERSPTIADIVASVPRDRLPIHFATHGVVCVNGAPVPRELWGVARPRASLTPTTITLHAPMLRSGGGSASGGGGKNVVTLVATIALVAATAFIGGGGLVAAGIASGGWFAAGSVSAALLAAGVGVAGSLAIAALAPSPQVAAQLAPDAVGAAGSTDSPREAASFEGNLLGRGEVLSRVIGTRKVYPKFVSQPLLDLYGDVEKYEAVAALSGPHVLGDIRIGDVPIADTDTEYETREGWDDDTPITIITRHAYTDAPGLSLVQYDLNKDIFTSGGAATNSRGLYQLSNGYNAGDLVSYGGNKYICSVGHTADAAKIPGVGASWASYWYRASQKLTDQASPETCIPKQYVFACRKNPDEIWLLLSFPQGIFNGEDQGPRMAVAVRIEMRLRGQSVWRRLPVLHFASRKIAPMQKMVKLIWATEPGTQPEPVTEDGPYLASLMWQHAQSSPVLSNEYSDAYFNLGSYATGPVGAFNYFNGDTGNYLQHTFLYADRAEIYLSGGGAWYDGGGWPVGTYDVRVQLSCVYETASYKTAGAALGYIPPGSAGARDLFYYVDDGGLFDAPCAQANMQGQAVIRNVSSVYNESPIQTVGCAIIAVRGQKVSQLSSLASGYVPRYDTGAGTWSDWGASSNPADHYRHALTAARLNADPLPLDLLDDDTLLEWRTRCALRRNTVDAICDGLSVKDVLDLTAASGLARPRQCETWAVAEDYDRSNEAPIQIFNPRNMAGFRYEKPLLKRAHGVRARFFDRSNEYREEEAYAYDDGYTEETAVRIEQINYDGLIDEAKVQERAQFDVDQVRLRSKIYYGDVDIENIVCRQGDLVGVTHDAINTKAGFARIKSVNRTGDDIDSIVLDAKISLAVTLAGGYWVSPDYWGTNDNFAPPGYLGAWVNSHAYVSGNSVSSASGYYVCTVNHTSSIIYEPGVGALWNFVWSYYGPIEATTGGDYWLANNFAPAGVAIRRLASPSAMYETTITRELANESAEETDTLNFAVPINDPDGLISEGCLVSTGELSREYRRLLVIGIKPTDKLWATIAMVDEAPELHAEPIIQLDMTDRASTMYYVAGMI